MAIEIRTAARRKAKLRIGFSGPSGSGKTYSSLLVARGLVDSWEEVLLIDTENGSGELYSDLGAYKIITLTAPFTPESYIAAIDAAEASGVKAIVIDSVSHEWDGKGGLLEANELLARAKFKGNTWAAWSETTPRHQKFIQSIVQSGCHLITTARAKTDTVQVDGKVKKVGTKEIQREGFEYELTVNFNLDRDGNYAIASKDRTEIFIHRDPFVISQKTGEELRAWNEAGIDAPDPRIVKAKKDIVARLKYLGTTDLANAAADVKRLTGLDLTPENYEEIIARLGAIAQERQEAAKAAPPAHAPEAQNAPVEVAPAPVAPSPVSAPEPAPTPEPAADPEATVYVKDTTLAYPDEDINPEDIPF